MAARRDDAPIFGTGGVAEIVASAAFAVIVVVVVVVVVVVHVALVAVAGKAFSCLVSKFP
jgi:hypothetical protein